MSGMWVLFGLVGLATLWAILLVVILIFLRGGSVRKGEHHASPLDQPRSHPAPEQPDPHSDDEEWRSLLVRLRAKD